MTCIRHGSDTLGAKAIYFDMDGTIADLYGVPNWLDAALTGSESPYIDAKPMFDAHRFDHMVSRLHADGWHIGIITWNFRGASKEYESKVERAKREWCKRHLPTLDEMKVVPYGVPKHDVADVKSDAILVDDDATNIIAWEAAGENCKGIDASNRASMFATLNVLTYGCIDD